MQISHLEIVTIAEPVRRTVLVHDGRIPRHYYGYRRTNVTHLTIVLRLVTIGDADNLDPHTLSATLPSLRRVIRQNELIHTVANFVRTYLQVESVPVNSTIFEFLWEFQH